MASLILNIRCDKATGYRSRRQAPQTGAAPLLIARSPSSTWICYSNVSIGVGSSHDQPCIIALCRVCSACSSAFCYIRKPFNHNMRPRPPAPGTTPTPGEGRAARLSRIGRRPAWVAASNKFDIPQIKPSCDSAANTIWRPVQPCFPISTSKHKQALVCIQSRRCNVFN